MHRPNAVLVSLFAGLALAAAASAGDAPAALGELEVRGVAELGDAADALALEDASHAYFAGDRLATGARSHAFLTLEGGALTLGPEAEADVGRSEGVHRVALRRGALRVQTSGGADFQVAAGEATIRSAAPAVDATVLLDGEGRVLVVARAGSVVAEAGGASEASRVDAGEQRLLASPTSLPDVAAEHETAAGPWARVRAAAPWLALGAGAAGTAWAVEQELDDDRDDDARPTSSPR